MKSKNLKCFSGPLQVPIPPLRGGLDEVEIKIKTNTGIYGKAEIESKIKKNKVGPSI
tara:strand:+ start:438 stop:608 length:171 start_codon:yes stop_codon:yes gene_type:complete